MLGQILSRRSLILGHKDPWLEEEDTQVMAKAEPCKAYPRPPTLTGPSFLDPILRPLLHRQGARGTLAMASLALGHCTEEGA